MELDHLVVTAPSVTAGADWVEQRLGVRPGPGGRHEGMGTHNLLLGLGPCYLEVLAVDPEAPAPPRPRWFGLDEPVGRPRLLHWVARVADVDRVAAATLELLGPVIAASRGELRWRITVPEDGHLPGGGVVPTLIEWDGPGAAERVADSGWRLTGLTGHHPDPPAVARVLHALGVVLEVSAAARPGLRATLSRGPDTAVLD